MRSATSLLPYALASAAVVIASAVAVMATVRPAGSGVTPPAQATPELRSGGQQATLSATGRLGYWRADTGGSLQLWVSDIDGGRRRTISTAASGTDISLTRWAPDGSAIAYVSGGASVALVRLDGPTGTLSIPLSLLRTGWRIVAIEWSPDAQRIAATFRGGFGTSNESDVYVAPTRSGARFEPVTRLGDAYAGRWVDSESLFIETSRGVTAVLDLRTSTLSPLTALPVTSPVIGADGRVYVIGGEVVPDVVTHPVGIGAVWSMTLDGDDLRRETAAGRAQLRLFGMLYDGRALAGVPGSVVAAGESVVPITFGAGSPRRILVSPDGRRIYGITEAQVLLIDAARIPRTAPARTAVEVPASVLLSDARSADVWFAATEVPLARGKVATAGARLAFTLGNAVWEQEPDGRLRDLYTGGSPGEPRWSPAGDRIAFARALGAPQPAKATVVGPGTVREWDLPTPLALPLEWSPDGRTLAFTVASGARRDIYTTHVYDAGTGETLGRTAGRAVWSGDARVVLTDGDPLPDSGRRVGQRVELLTGTTTRVVTDASRIAIALREELSGEGPPAIERVLPSPGGEYLALAFRGGTSGVPRDRRVVVVRISDGALMAAPRMEPLGGGVTFNAFDLSWSSDGTKLAWTTSVDGGSPASQAFVPHPVVLDVKDPGQLATPKLTVLAEGRFGGWAPDGRVYFFLRPEDGLFVEDLASGGTSRAGAIATRVVATSR